MKIKNLDFLKMIYNGLLIGMPSFASNPINKNNILAPMCVNKYSTYILRKDTQEKTLKKEIFFTKKLTNTLCSHLLVAIYFTFILLEIKEWRPAVWFSEYENLIYKNLEKNILELGEKEKPFLKIDEYSEKNRETIISVKEYLSEINLAFN